jgi:hypothetical protein
MSKAKKPRAAPQRKRMPKSYRSMPQFVRGRVDEIKEHLRDPEFIFKGLPPAISKSVSEAAENLAWDMIKHMPELENVNVSQRTGIRVVANLAVEMGFVMALYRFEDTLQGEAELAEWRASGIKKGHETQSRGRIQRAAAIREKWRQIETAGGTPTNEMVAAAIGCSVSTVIRAFRDGHSPSTKAK